MFAQRIVPVWIARTFTEPSDGLGANTSRVAFTYELTEMPPWAETPALQAAIPQLKTDLLQAEHEGTATMVLTDKAGKLPTTSAKASAKAFSH